MATSETPVLPGHPVREFTAGHGFPGFEPLTVVALDEETLVSRHRLTPEELAEVARTGTVYVLYPRAPKRFVPVRVQAAQPEFTLPALAADLPGCPRLHFHGLEVSDAGGAEEDRLDYAAAEAAAALVAGARLPCRVALLAEKMEWVELGGEECATRDLLEAAVVRRLKKMLGEGGRRFEARDATGASFRVAVVEMTPAQCREGEAVSVPG